MRHTSAELRQKKRKKIFGVISVLTVLLLSLFLSYFLILKFSKIAKTGEEFRDYINSFGTAGIFVAVGIQILQVFIALIPGEFVEIGMGYAYGWLSGALLSLLGVAIGSTMIFLLVKKYGIRLVSINGGSKANAIPRDCEAVITAERDISAEIKALSATVASELSTRDREGFYLECEAVASKARAMTKEASDKLIFMLSCIPNGVLRQSTAVRGVVDQSVNMGIVETSVEGDYTNVKIVFNMRSSIETLMDETAEIIASSGILTPWCDSYLSRKPLRISTVSSVLGASTIIG